MLYQFNLLKRNHLLAIIMVCGISISSGMEAAMAPQTSTTTLTCVLQKRKLEVGEIPSGYISCPIAQQLKYYREAVYDAALEEYGGNIEALKIKPIRGLSLVLENAFALVHDTIKKDKGKPEEDKAPYINALQKGWRQAAEFENELTPALFYKFNQYIAYIMESYNEGQEISVFKRIVSKSKEIINQFIEVYSSLDDKQKADDLKRILQDALKSLNELKEDEVADPNEYFKDFMIDLTNKLANQFGEGYRKSYTPLTTYTYGSVPVDDSDINIEKMGTINQIVFIVYGSPNPSPRRLISPVHFVEQFCDKSYSAYIAFFDVLSVKKAEGTKKDPHWSLENGTKQMLMHDFEHIDRQTNNLKAPQKEYAMNIMDIQKKYKDMGDNNAATILTDGLFMLLHEQSDSLRVANNSTLTIKDVTDKATGYLGGMMIRLVTRLYGTEDYKKEQRDWEFILKDKYLDQDGQIKPVHDGNGIPFLPIEYDPVAKKMTRPFADVTDKVVRNEKMKENLVDGYKRFWIYFRHLIENVPDLGRGVG